jgi:diguanylate cyclase (GGDEF)-like protein
VISLSNESLVLSVLPMSLNDELTELYNRQGFICAADHLLGCARSDERFACLLSLHINHWDVIAHALGVEVAEGFLLRTGACLREVFERSAVIGRISPQRFAVLFLVPAPSECSALFDQLIEMIDRRNARRSEINLSVLGGFFRFETRSPISIQHLLTVAESRLETALQSNSWSHQ